MMMTFSPARSPGIGCVLRVANGNFDLPLMFAGLFVPWVTGVILFVALSRLTADP